MEFQDLMFERRSGFAANDVVSERRSVDEIATYRGF